MDVLDYKRKIIEMLDNADDRRLRLIYIYIKAILGLN
nr:MAG TPA: putative DNA-binding domain protein [Caudoviricetes sp.]